VSLALLYQQLDPAEPLKGDDPRYVDWQDELDADDVKTRLVSSVRNSNPSLGSQRLLTGPRGSGKSTELYRVKSRLAAQSGDGCAFVSFLEGQWFDLLDLDATDVSFNVVRQLVDDLAAIGVPFKADPLRRLKDALKNMTLTVSLPFGLAVSTALKESRTERVSIRDVLETTLPRVWDDINAELIGPAKAALREAGFNRVVVIVDDLDKIDPRPGRTPGLSNLDELYISGAGKLRALQCDVIYTVPLDFAYGTAAPALNDRYGEVLDLALVPTRSRHGERAEGVGAMREIVQRRFAAAHVDFDVFEGGIATVDDIIEFSGGQVRQVFTLLRAAIDRESPDATGVQRKSVDRAVASLRRSMLGGLDVQHRAMLARVRETNEKFPTDPVFQELLRTARVLPYAAGGEQWYDVHPLLDETARDS
jgi:hypothetical protein